MLTIAVVGFMTLMSSTCNKNDETNDRGTCTGYVAATATGSISANFYFDDRDSCTYLPNDRVGLWACQSGTITITQIDQDNFKGTFNVVAVGFYNKETINLVGQ